MADLPSWLAPIAVSPIAAGVVGTLIRRLPRSRRSTLTSSEDVPPERPLSLISAASHIALFKRIQASHGPIGSFHFAITLAALAVAVSAALVYREIMWLWGACFLGWTLLALAWIDAAHMRLPDALTLPLIPIGILVQTILNFEHFVESAVGAIVGYGSFRTVALVYRVVRRRDGLGGGDAKLLSAAGAWVGWTALPDVVLLASLIGLGFIASRRIQRITVAKIAIIPFGPSLAIALWTIYLLGPFVFDGLR